jgi:hypothetical protein
VADEVMSYLRGMRGVVFYVLATIVVLIIVAMVLITIAITKSDDAVAMADMVGLSALGTALVTTLYVIRGLLVTADAKDEED